MVQKSSLNFSHTHFKTISITESAADKDIEVVAEKLTSSFNSVKQYCASKQLVVNTSKTQLIILKTPTRKIPQDFKLVLDNCGIEPMKSVKLLGVTIDRHLTMGDHIDAVVRKCQGLLQYGGSEKSSTKLTSCPGQTSIHRFDQVPPNIRECCFGPLLQNAAG